MGNDFQVGLSIPCLGDAATVRHVAAMLDRDGFDSFWCADHVSFPEPILDPLLQLAQVAILNPRITVGTAIYLLPLRHPTPVAKQIASLDVLTGGRFVFGVGVGGEFPNEYAGCGVPVGERGARMTEAVGAMRKLWSGDAVSHRGRFFAFDDLRLQPPPVQPGGPPIWAGGRSDAALRRAGRMLDGWIGYLVTPDRWRRSMDMVRAAAAEAGRDMAGFTPAVLIYVRIDDDADRALADAAGIMGARYAMDFREAARRYVAYGSPANVAAHLRGFRDAGVRHLVVELIGTPEERDRQSARFGAEVRPLLAASA